ncbi:MAG: type II toxin-antitoxin system RelE/ParE family toxin [Promicromonosporaceae bacterium]|nr:type II toxin-antitoxin system RelE/ParE family toxin [Promicromonosporaceae bacterium]
MTNGVYRVAYFDDAINHLYSIEDYLIQVGEPQNAFDFTDRIRHTCDRLSAFPQRHRRRDDVDDGLHVTGMEGKVTITYYVDERAKLVTIVGVHYGGQNWETMY